MNFVDPLKAERDAFYAGERTSALPLAINDMVRVKEGEQKNQLGSVISLEHLLPEAHYLVELGSGGGDVVLSVSQLERLEPERE